MITSEAAEAAIRSIVHSSTTVQQQQQKQQQQQQQQQPQKQTQLIQFDPFSSGALAPWADPFAMTAFSPWGGNLGGGMLAPFSDPLLSSTMNELQRVQQRALQSLPPQLRLDVFETDKELKVRADLPGVCDKDMQIHIDENNMLSVQAEKSDSLQQDETRGLYNFHRS